MWIIEEIIERYNKVGVLSFVFLALIFVTYLRMIYDFKLIHIIYFSFLVYYLKEFVYQKYGL